MSSSTSSSRGIYLKILTAITLGMGASVGIIRLITYANDVSGDTILGRVYEARDALPQITAEENPVVMFFGSSMVEAGFSPRQFDRQAAEHAATVKSFNFGFGGLNPLYQDYLSRRIEDAFNEKNRRLKLAMIEFNPFQATVTRRQRALPDEDAFITMLADDKEIWEWVWRDPERGIRMLNIRYIRDNISAEMITHHFGGDLRAPMERISGRDDEEVVKRRDELGQKLVDGVREDYPDYPNAAWYYPWQGGGTIPEERSPEMVAMYHDYYATLRTEYRMKSDRLRRVQTADILQLNFDEELIEAFIRIVKNFQRFSDQVAVIMLPRNTAWIQYPPEARARLDDAVARIERETGLEIYDFQDLDAVTPEMFSDTTHLARYSGDVAFTQHLVETFAEDLKP
ncbi:MAG: D-alanyl-lipoteichoic acid biosynthesis protein DltD [Acidobacteriota bacterium]|nr:D-alanyl-lipoteichoic acid biosynthesis protein DltD [Acidobacteriota bacterium]